MIAVWYHCKISGEGIPSREHAASVVIEQMRALKNSGLEGAANEIHIGINGGDDDLAFLLAHAPERSEFHVHGHKARSELHTLRILQSWIRSNPWFYVFYHHSKGVTQPGSEEKSNHRRTMEKALVWNWSQCVADLARGFEAVGINLVDPDTRPAFGRLRFFAGNFWWARAEYLLQLPTLPPTVKAWTVPERCRAEFWIGQCRRRPVMLDYERPELYLFWERQGTVRK